MRASEPPDLRQLHQLLMDAERLRLGGNSAAARNAVERLLSVVPTYAAAWSLLGSIHHAAGDAWAAVNAFQRSAMVHFPSHVTHLHIARCFQELSAFEMAEAALATAEGLKPDAPEIHAARGRLLAARRAYDPAIAELAKARNADRNNVEVTHTLGETLLYAGRDAEALDLFVDAYQMEKIRNPKSRVLPSLLYSIAQSPAADRRIDVLKEATTLEKTFPAGAPGDGPARLGFVRALAFDRERRFEEAWQALTAANNYIWRTSAAKEAAAAAERNQKVLGHARAAGKIPERSRDESEPVALFVTGPSRAGKSVLEGLLANAMPDAQRAFESGIVEPAVTITALQNELPPVTLPMLLPGELKKAFANNLRRQIRQVADGRSVVIDTHPANVALAGDVVRALPNAFFVFVGRDESDNTLRCLQRIYSTGNWYSYDVDECRRHLSWHREIAQVWAERLPGRSLMVDYAEIVGDPAGVVRRIANAIGRDVTPDTPAIADDRGCSLPYSALQRKS